MEETNAPSMLLEKQYHIPLELFRKAFTAFQKRYVYPRNYLMMAIFLLVFCFYCYFIVTGTDSDRPIYCMIAMLCLVMCALQWFNPRKIRRNLMEAVKEIEEDQYRLRIFPEYLEIGTILPEEEASREEKEADGLFDDAPEENFTGTRIYYNKGMHLTEYKDFFMLYQKKSMFYVIPKSAFTEEETEIMRVHFSQRLEKSFAQKLR